jgi:hypothetical protein
MLPIWRSSSRAVLIALSLTLTLAWLNFVLTARWADLPGALNGARRPWYAAALAIATLLVLASRRSLGQPARVGTAAAASVLVIGWGLLAATFFSRMPVTLWTQIPFKDDWTELFQVAVNGTHLLRRGVVVGWDWWFLGGYPTSTEIAQNLAALAVLPMTLLGDRLGYHVLHLGLFLAPPAFIWWDLQHEDREAALIGAGLAGFLAAGYSVTIANSGDTNSLAGVFCAGLALTGSRAAFCGRRWGAPLQMLGLTLAFYTHAAFGAYAVAYLALEAMYFRDRRAAMRLVLTVAFAGLAALPVHYESFRYPGFVSFNNTVYDPSSPRHWDVIAKNVYYNVEILAFPQRWFNDYRSMANIWLPTIVLVALQPSRTRPGFYAWTVVLTQCLLRLNAGEVGAMFDRIQHMLPLLTGPALAGVVLTWSGTRRVAVALLAVMGLYVATGFQPIRHVPELRAFNPPLLDRIASADGMVLVEISPHRSMDIDPDHHSARTPFDVHFEGLLPGLAGQRFYSQMFDGWAWNIFRGQVVGAGTFRGQVIDRTPPEQFVGEMRRWGVRHLFVWTDETRKYLERNDQFTQTWDAAPWSAFELRDADVRSVVVPAGRGELRDLDFLGGNVALTDVTKGEPVVVRANYYPAWQAFAGSAPVPLRDVDGQLAFDAPESGSYTVRLEYPRYRVLTLSAMALFVAGLWTLWRLRAVTDVECRSPAGTGEHGPR